MEFNPLFSTKETFRDDDRTKCLEYDLLAIKEPFRTIPA